MKQNMSETPELEYETMASWMMMTSIISLSAATMYPGCAGE
jgi:hypothetical protein